MGEEARFGPELFLFDRLLAAATLTHHHQSGTGIRDCRCTQNLLKQARVGLLAEASGRRSQGECQRQERQQCRLRVKRTLAAMPYRSAKRAESLRAPLGVGPLPSTSHWAYIVQVPMPS